MPVAPAIPETFQCVTGTANPSINIEVLTTCNLTGALGFEPRNGGTKTRCLTTWLRPIGVTLLMVTVSTRKVSSLFREFGRKVENEKV